MVSRLGFVADWSVRAPTRCCCLWVAVSFFAVFGVRVFSARGCALKFPNLLRRIRSEGFEGPRETITHATGPHPLPRETTVGAL